MMLLQYIVTSTVLILVIQCSSSSTVAFTPSFYKVTTPIISNNNGRRILSTIVLVPGTSTCTLFMSDMLDDKDKLPLLSPPPKPEDMIVLTGDLLSIAVYGFLDHFLSKDLMAATVNRATTTEQLSLLVEQFASSSSSSSLTTTSSSTSIDTPVWVDSTITPNLSKIYQITVSDQLVTHYSPLLQQTGLAVTVLASCWLLSGWIHEAFLYKNTLLCRTDTALLVTGKTWITCSLLLFTLTSFSQYICNDCYTNFALFSYTKGDIDFIIDSLSVLTMWRFLISYLFGTSR